MRNKWTTEQIEWLESNASRDRHDLIKKFNETFNANITMAALRSIIYRFDLKLPSPRIRWTKDKLDWLESQSFNDKRDLLKAFNEKYIGSNALARDWIYTLQELVDKETPMKPLEDNYLGEFMCECGSPITKDYKYCPNCGQKLNWNKKEPCSSCKYNKICRVKK